MEQLEPPIATLWDASVKPPGRVLAPAAIWEGKGQRRGHLLHTHDLRCPGPASIPMTSHSPRRRLGWQPLSTALAKLPSSFRTQVPQAHPVGTPMWGQLGGSASRRARGGVPTQHSQWRLGGPEGGFTVPGVWEPGTPWETLRPAETRLAEGVELDA